MPVWLYWPSFKTNHWKGKTLLPKLWATIKQLGSHAKRPPPFSLSREMKLFLTTMKDLALSKGIVGKQSRCSPRGGSRSLRETLKEKPGGNQEVFPYLRRNRNDYQSTGSKGLGNYKPYDTTIGRNCRVLHLSAGKLHPCPFVRTWPFRNTKCSCLLLSKQRDDFKHSGPWNLWFPHFFLAACGGIGCFLS